MRPTRLRLAIAVLATFAATVALAQPGGGGVRYKWRDADGNLHYGDSLPKDIGSVGYEVINAQGVVVKRVERARTAEERAADKVAADRAQAERVQAETQARNDRQMLAAYPNESNLRRAHQQQLEMIDQNLEAARTSLLSQEKSLADQLGQAANYENANTAIPAKLTQQIAALRKQIEQQRMLIARKEAERARSVDKATAELAHYRSIRSGETAAPPAPTPAPAQID